jgi:hypothetical protein
MHKLGLIYKWQKTTFISLLVIQWRNKFTPPKFQQKLSAPACRQRQGWQVETPCLLPTFRLWKSRKEDFSAKF